MLTIACLAMNLNNKSEKSLHLLFAMFEKGITAKEYLYADVIYHLFDSEADIRLLELAYELKFAVCRYKVFKPRPSRSCVAELRVEWLLRDPALYDTLEDHLVLVFQLYKDDKPEKLRNVFESVVMKMRHKVWLVIFI